MSEPVVVPGPRDVRGSLDTPVTGGEATDGAGDSRTRETTACVVACPPHPQFGGSRSDRRLRAVAEALVDRGVACLRFDYGPWDEGRGERRDATNALVWARERYDRVGLFGYSFGAGVALRAAAAAAPESATDARAGPEPAAVSALAPPGDAARALADIDRPVQVVYGERDDTVDWRPVVDRARELGLVVEGLAADHHFVGQADSVADAVATFMADALE